MIISSKSSLSASEGEDKSSLRRSEAEPQAKTRHMAVKA